MKTMLWATLSANGNYAQSGHGNPPNQDAFKDFVTNAMTAGNFIVGRRTYEGMLESGGIREAPLAHLDVIVVSSHVTLRGRRLSHRRKKHYAFCSRKGIKRLL
jgi:dihydrofolate reductase